MLQVRLTLEEAIRWAIRKSFGVLSENLNVDIARREIVLARATFDPFFNAGLTFTKNREPSVSFIDIGNKTGVVINPTDSVNFQSSIRGLSPIGTTYQFSLIETRLNNPSRASAGFQSINPLYNTRAQISITQPLLKNAWYSYNTANVRTAENDAELSRKKLEQVAIDVVFSVESAYWDLVYALKNFQAKEKALEVTQEQLRIDQRKLQVGTKAQIDVTTSQSQVARRKTEYDMAASLLEDARDNLLDRMNYVGTEETLKDIAERSRPSRPYKKYGDIVIVPTTEPASEPFLPDRSESIQKAFAQRTEYIQSDLQIRNQDIAVSVAKNQLLPSLDITGTWTQLGLDQEFDSSVNRLFDGDFYDWSVGALFEVPLSYRGPRAQYRNARDLRQRLEIEKKNLENAIVLEIDRALRSLEYNYRIAKSLEELVELQKEVLRAERVKLDVGKSIPYAVAVIENDLVLYFSQLQRAKADYEIAKSSYRKAVGELLKKWSIDLGQ